VLDWQVVDLHAEATVVPAASRHVDMAISWLPPLRQFALLTAYLFQCKISGGYTGVLEYSIEYSIEYSDSKLFDSGSPNPKLWKFCS